MVDKHVKVSAFCEVLEELDSQISSQQLTVNSIVSHLIWCELQMDGALGVTWALLHTFIHTPTPSGVTKCDNCGLHIYQPINM